MITIIVRQGAHEMYDRLHAVFRDVANVVWDRRRRHGSSPSGERRQPPPTSWVALGFVVVDRKER